MSALGSFTAALRGYVDTDLGVELVIDVAYVKSNWRPWSPKLDDEILPDLITIPISGADGYAKLKLYAAAIAAADGNLCSDDDLRAIRSGARSLIESGLLPCMSGDAVSASTQEAHK